MAEDLVQVAEEISSESEIKEIPIDKPIQDFYNHLSYNERIIFSAKFGDGKTYFLNKFFEENKDEFEAIRIFPVNYQVADNKDVFELIKKDILIHLLANDLVEDEDFFDESIYAQNYLFNNGADIILDILSSVSAVKTPVEILQKSLKQIRKFKEEKGEAKKTSVDFVEDYLRQFEEGIGVAEYDVISELITRIVKSIHDKGKKVVLVIDDLDRIDPAHLFRILNVLTAHIDREVVLQNEIVDGVGNNKFNFDHIITVFDYHNAENIFHHLYGSGTDFNGYISKFITGKQFEYSLKQISVEYVIEYLSKNRGIDKRILIIDGIKSFISNSSIRHKLTLLNNFGDEIVDGTIEEKGVKFSSINSFTCFLVLLKRLNINFSNIIAELVKADSQCLFNLVGVGLFFGSRINISDDSFRIQVDLESSSFYESDVWCDVEGGFIKNIKFGEISGKVDSRVLSAELRLVYNKFETYIML